MPRRRQAHGFHVLQDVDAVLRLDAGLFNHFEVLTSDLLDRICTAVLEAGLPLGVGGVARADDRNLPVPANLVHSRGHGGVRPVRVRLQRRNRPRSAESPTRRMCSRSVHDR